MSSKKKEDAVEALPPLTDILDTKIQAYNKLISELAPPTNLISRLASALSPGDLFSAEQIHTRTFLRVRPLMPGDSDNFPGKPLTHVPFLKVAGKRDGVLLSFRMKPNGTPVVEPFRIAVDGGFFCSNPPEKDTNEDLYEAIIPPLLQKVAGGNAAAAAVLAYGALGTGKTFTIRGLIDCLCQDLIPLLATTSIALNVIELHALGSLDMLTGEDVQVLESPNQFDGTGVNVQGVTDFPIQSSTTLKKVIKMIFDLRDKNPKASAISTMVFRFVFTPKSTKKGECSAGQLFLVDLASIDALSAPGSSGQGAIKDMSRNIVSSFFALRDCIRLRVARKAVGTGTVSASGQQDNLPFRTSHLTLLLNKCFDHTVQSAKVVTICTLSPSIAQMKFIGETLKFAQSISVNADSPNEVISALPPLFALGPGLAPDPLGWPVAKLHEFLFASSFGRLLNPSAVFTGVDSRACMEMLNTNEDIDGLVALHGFPKRMVCAVWQAVLRLLLEQKGPISATIVLGQKKSQQVLNTSSGSTAPDSQAGATGTAPKVSKFAQIVQKVIKTQAPTDKLPAAGGDKGPAPAGGGAAVASSSKPPSGFAGVVKLALLKAKADAAGGAGAGAGGASTNDPPTAASSTPQPPPPPLRVGGLGTSRDLGTSNPSAEGVTSPTAPTTPGPKATAAAALSSSFTAGQPTAAVGRGSSSSSSSTPPPSAINPPATTAKSSSSGNGGPKSTAASGDATSSAAAGSPTHAPRLPDNSSPMSKNPRGSSHAHDEIPPPPSPPPVWAAPAAALSPSANSPLIDFGRTDSPAATSSSAASSGQPSTPNSSRQGFHPFGRPPRGGSLEASLEGGNPTMNTSTQSLQLGSKSSSATPSSAVTPSGMHLSLSFGKAPGGGPAAATALGDGGDDTPVDALDATAPLRRPSVSFRDDLNEVLATPKPKGGGPHPPAGAPTKAGGKSATAPPKEGASKKAPPSSRK